MQSGPEEGRRCPSRAHVRRVVVLHECPGLGRLRDGHLGTNLNSGGTRWWLNLANGSWWTWPNISQPVRVIPASAAPEALADMFRTHGQEPRR